MNLLEREGISHKLLLVGIQLRAARCFRQRFDMS